MKRRLDVLTDLKLKRYKSLEGKRHILWDKGGLGIRIGEKHKIWVFRYSFEGRRLMMALGEYPAKSLEEARKEAAEAALKVKRGIDPAAEKKMAREARIAAPTIEQFVNEIDTFELAQKKSGKETKRLLNYDVVPVWGKRKVADIKRRDIVLLLDSIRKRAPITANRVHSALSRLFNFAAERGVIEDSPCTRIRKSKETAKSRTLTDDELKRLWGALDLKNKAVDMYVITKLALKTILLTGQRPGQVCGMTLDEINGDIWTVPADRMKGNEPHSIPLTGMVLEVIELARAYSNGSPYVFCSTHKDGAPITPGALSRAILRHWEEEMGFEEPFTPHDLRRTVRTRLAELGIDDIVAERVMGHKLQGMLGVYNRHDYEKEKREALEKWEKKLRLIVGLDQPDAAKNVSI